MEGEETKQGHRSYWSDCEQIFFIDSIGYGLTEQLETISLGKEGDIRHFFKTGKINPNLFPIQRQVLSGILDYRKEEGFGISERDMVRAGNNGVTGGEQKAVSSIKKGKELALRASHKKYNHLLRG